MIRITTNDKTEEVLDLLEEEYKTLSRAEIFKLALSELYNKARDSKIELLDMKTSIAVEKSRKQMKSGEYKAFDNVEDLISDLSS